MEYLFNPAMSFRVVAILAKPVTFFPSIMRAEIEPIPDPAPLPPRPKQDLYAAVLTPDGLIPKDRLAEHLKKGRNEAMASVLDSPAALKAFKDFALCIITKYGDPPPTHKT